MSAPDRSEITSFVYQRLGWVPRDPDSEGSDRIRLTEVPPLAPMKKVEEAAGPRRGPNLHG